MLDSLLIKNFRIFKSFEIKRLNRVNLFVGKNNSGKSCLLEAIQIYATKGFRSLLHDLISSRDENWEYLIIQKEEYPVQQIEAPLRHLFFGYHIPDIDEDGIEIGSLNIDINRVCIVPKAFQIIEESDGSRKRLIISRDEMSKELEDVQLGLEIREVDKRIDLLPLSSDIRESLLYRRRYFNQFRDIMYNYQIVPTQNMDIKKIEALWNNISLTDLVDDLIKGLNIIEPKITGVALVGESRERRDARSVPIVKCKDIEERIPLKTMGDGLTRLFNILLALVNSRDGFLLIDEFENGLYWGIHAKVWEIIFKISEELNVQVFATTHSQDCVRGFFSTWSSMEKNGSFHRLETDPEKGAKAINYTCDTLSDALETLVEVR